MRVGSAILAEGDSFLVGLEQSFVVPANPAPLEFRYSDLHFDTSDPDSINDAFEVSLVDAAGRNVVHPFAAGRDAFFNITEEAGRATGPGVSESGGAIRTVSLDLSAVPAGTEAAVRFRLVNNDSDTQTTVRILEVLVPAASQPPQINPVADQTVPEGTALVVSTTVIDTDPGDSHAAVVAWGDGTSSPASISVGANGVATVSAAHTYADNGNYAATLTVTDSQDQSASDTFTVTVRNVAPTLEAGLAFEAVGPDLAVVLAGEFRDPGFDRPAAATTERFVTRIVWGDGSSEVADVPLEQGSEGRQTRGRLAARHTYAQAGVYTATVTVTDDDGGTASASYTFGVASIDVVPSINLQSNGVIPVKVFHGPGFHAALIDAASLRFGPGGALEEHGDVHGGGDDHVMTHFRTQASGIRPTDTIAFLSGRLADGTPFVGMDSIRIVQGGGGTPPTSPAAGTKFFVVDPTADRAFRYGPDGAATGSFTLDPVAANSRGAASNAAGDRLWVIDGTTHAVTVQGTDGRVFGSWRADGLVRPEDLATDGTDVWMVDAAADRVFRYPGGAGRTGGVALPASSFALHAENGSPTGLAIRGGVLWVTDDVTDAVFVHDTSGSLLGRWSLDSANANPSGITGDPTGVSPDLWVVDRDDRAVYRYAAGTAHRAGNQSAAGTFALVSGNARPEGIADPPGGGSFTIGSVVAENIGAAGEVDVWTFQATAGQRLFFDLQTSSISAFLRWTLTDPSGTPLFSNVAGDHDVLTLATSGEYSLAVSAILSQTGTYQFQVWEVPLPTTTPFQIGDVVSGSIGIPGERDLHTFTATAGQRLFFDVQDNGGAFSRLGFTLLRPDGTAVFPATISDVDTFSLAESGVYTVVVGAFIPLSAVDNYRFQIWAVPPVQTQPINLNELVAGTLDVPGENDEYTFSSVAGQRLYFDVRDAGENFDAIGFSIRNPNGTVLFASSPSDRGVFTAPQTGTYTIVAGANATQGIGAYAFGVFEVADPGPGVSPDSKGTDFWLTFPGNHRGLFQQGVPELRFFISAEEDTRVSVVIQGVGFATSVIARAGQITTVELPSLADLGLLSDRVTTNGIHVTSTKEVTIYGINRIPFTTDAYLALPVDILGRDYLVLGYENSIPAGLSGPTPSQLAIVGTADGTVVTLTPSVTVGTRPAGVPFSVTLNRGQTYQLLAQGLAEDLTGTRIHSTQPVAVFGGSMIARVPFGFTAADHLVEQMPPLEAWGRKFYTVPLATRLAGDTFRFLAGEDDTTVRMNGDVVATLDRGQHHEQIVTGMSAIESDKPILVAQYSNSSSFDGVTSDPFMVLIPPYEQFLAAYTVSTPSSGFAINYLNLVATEEVVGQITLDGTPVDADLFQRIGQSHFFGAQVEVGTGAFNLSAPLPFGVTVYGFNSFDSYGYPGGLSLASVARVSRVSLTPAVASYTVGQLHQATATITDGVGLPLRGVRVDFRVAGSNESLGFAFTDEAGLAHFSYVGTGPGTDTLTASVGAIADTTAIEWTVPAPTLFVTQPLDGSTLDAGTPVIVVGVALAGRPPLPGNAAYANSIVQVTINRRPVEALDAAGQFFGQTTILPGRNVFTVTATDALGQTVTQDVVVTGVQRLTGESDFTLLSDVTASFAPRYARTSYQQQESLLHADWVIDNVGQYPADAPLFVGVTNISDPRVQVRGHAGTTPDGVPYYDFSGAVPGGTLAPGETTLVRTLTFFNPEQVRFTYDLVFFGLLNRAPQIVSVPGIEAPAGRPYAYDVGALDADGDDLTYRLLSGPAAMTIDTSMGGLAWSPTNADIGSHAVAVQVSDGRGGITEQRFALTVIEPPPNRPPVFTSVPVVSVSVGEDYGYTAAAREFDGDGLTFSLVSGPAGLTVTGTSEVRWRPTAGQIGSHLVVLRVSDGRGGTATQEYAVEVLQETAAPTNTAPVITSTLPTVTLGVGLPFAHDVKAQDADGDRLSYRLDGALPGMSIDSDTGRFRWAPAANQTGAHQVAVVVSDGRGGEDRRLLSFSVETAPVNDDPVIRSQPRVATGLNLPYAYLLDVFDANGDPLTFTLTAAPAGMTVDADGLVTWQPTPGQVGTHPVALLVGDSRGGTATQSFDLTVVTTPDNAAPLIFSTPLFTGVVGTPYRLDLEANDPDGDPVLWSLVEGPRGMALGSATGALTWLPGSDQVGEHTVVVRAEDPFGGAGTQSFTVTVSALNRPPLITSVARTTAGVDRPYAYAVGAVDADGDKLSFSLPVGPTGMSVDSSGLIRWTPTDGQVGLHAVTVLAEDGQGNSAAQTFFVNVSLLPPNQAPLITSTPQLMAVAGLPYTTTVRGTDPEGLPLTFAFAGAPPAGMTIEGQTGVIAWTPAQNQAGDHVVTVTASDPDGGSGSQTFTLRARANQVPAIISTPPGGIAGGPTFRYDVRATDPEGGRLNFALTAGPAGMTIDGFGRMRWITTPADVGSYPVTVTVTDEFGQGATQDFLVNVTADTEAPRVNLVATLGTVDLGAVVLLRVLASDNVAVTDLRLTVGGVPLALDPSGTAVFTAEQAGLFDVVATATDAAGNVGRATQSLRVVDPRDEQAPHVTITAPTAGALLTTLTDVVGTVDDPEDELAFYHVYYARSDQVDPARVEWDQAEGRLSDPDYILLSEGRTEVSNGRLATFDPTRLRNDGYVIVVAAFDTGGRGWVESRTVDLTGGLKLGEFRVPFTDLSIPLAGIPIQVTRVYDTRQSSESGDFGFGWTLDVAQADIRETVPQTPAAFFATGAPFRIGTRVYLTNPAGERVGFTFDPVPIVNAFLGVLWTPRFTADPGVYDRLEVAPLSLKQQTDGTFISTFIGFPYNPDEYRLVTPQGVAYDYHQSSGLRKITDTNGNIVTLTHDGIFASTGEAVRFERDPQGRIAKVIDPDDGELDYSYDAAGDLTTVTNQEGLTRTFDYRTDRPHYLEEVKDPLGSCELMLEYGPTGELVATMNEVGSRVERHFDVAAFTGEIRDARGNLTRLVYNERGNVTREQDAEGNVTLYEYADPQNPDRETAVTNPRGFVTRYTYDARGNVLTETTDVGTTAYTYTALNKVATVTDPLRRVTTNEYDDRGNLTAVVNALGDRREFTYDVQGRPLTASDFRGNFTTLVYSTGSSQPLPSQVINPDGTARSFTYNSFGQQTSITDEEGHVTRTVYDRSGRPTQAIDGEGEVTRFVYVGTRLEREISPEGHVTRYEYDAAGRLTARVDAEDGRVEFTHDLNGNVLTMTDAERNVTAYAYDRVNRATRETDPLGRSTLYAYDGADNVTEVVDRNGRRRTFAYDAIDRPTGETWWSSGSAVYTATYQYDAANNLLLAADPYSRYAVSYDALNRVTSVDNAGTPDQPHVVFTYGYDADGRRTLVSDSAGVRIESAYNRRGWLASRTWEGGGVDPVRVDFDYFKNGLLRQLDRFADLIGTGRVGRSAYEYDRRGLVTSILHRGGADAVLSDYAYAYDGEGWVSRLTLNGRVADYTYDRTGQLTDVTYSGGQPHESYRYDANGNRTGANGLNYTTGAGNRLLSDGVYNYEYDNSGNLVRKTEIATGDATTFAYDHRGRLTSVVERSAGGIILSEVGYEYDVFDRRIAVVTNGTRITTVYDGEAAWADFNAAETIIARYLHGDQVDELLAHWRPGEGTAWYLTDRLGTVRDLLNAAGAAVNRIEYTSFGQILSHTNPAAADRFAFTGREFDATTGLNYYRARYYDPLLGRFTSEDPARFAAGDANLYRYVANGPTNATDPTGETSLVEYRATLCIGATVLAVSGIVILEASLAVGLTAVALGIHADLPLISVVFAAWGGGGAVLSAGYFGVALALWAGCVFGPG